MRIDGNTVDMVTIAVGVVTALISPLSRYIGKQKPYFVRETATVDMLNGVMLVPFLMMVGSVFSSDLLKELLSSAKITLAIGGLAGLIFVLGELCKTKA